MTDLVSVPPAARGVEKPLRCIGCDVTWRGTSADVCWNCGAAGVPLGNVRLVEDEPWELSVEDEPWELSVEDEPADLGIEGESAA